LRFDKQLQNVRARMGSVKVDIGGPSSNSGEYHDRERLFKGHVVIVALKDKLRRGSRHSDDAFACRLKLGLWGA
jgi:hypothetical protein